MIQVAAFEPLLFLAALFVLLTIGSPGAKAAFGPGNLRSEYLQNPLGLDQPQPRLSWIVDSDVRGQRQTAYQLLVGSTDAAIKAGQGDLWDSGKVASDATAQVRYGGKALTSGQRAWWAVRIWDKDGNPSAWSTPAFWEMGLLTPDQWHGKWIARTDDISALAAPLLRRGFTLDGQVESARLYISGLGYYEMTINGKRVGDHLLDPGYTRYDRRVLYVTHDVTDMLKAGDNVLGCMLGNGWFNVQEKAAWNFDTAPWRASARMRLELRVAMQDGRNVTISSDEQWKTSEGPITFNCIYGGENWDARLEQAGWDMPGFDDKKWQPAIVVDAPKGSVVAQAMHPIRLVQTIKPVAVNEPVPGVYVFDAGQNLTGNAELIISAPAGTKISMRYSEKLMQTGRVDQSNINIHVLRSGRDQQFQTDSYTLKGEGVERWHSHFNYNGFRYVEVTGSPVKLTPENLSIRVFHSDVPLAGSFECSNPLMNKIWIAGRWSYLSNLFGIPTDCPQREKNGWTGDAHVACEQGLFYADGFTVYQKWINDLGDEQRPTGALPGIVPTNGIWGYGSQRGTPPAEGLGAGPAWDSAFLLVPWYLYEYYGDDSVLKAHYDGYVRYIDYLTSRATFGSPADAPQTTHLIQIGLGDWSPYRARCPVVVTDTAYYHQDARIVATVARMLGKEADAKKYDALADTIREAFNKQIFNPETGVYGDGSQCALGCALYQGLVGEQDKSRVTEALAANIKRNDDHLDFGMLGSKYVLNALSDNGRADVAYTIASQKTRPSWGYWIESGATTLYEGWSLGASNNHTFLGDIDAWMIKTLAGINPDPAAPGFKHIVIHPHPVGDLTSAKATYDSVRGRIVSDWAKQDDGFRLTVTIPANTTATVYLPGSSAGAVREGGRSLEQADGVKLNRVENGCVVVDVQSGTYVFAVKL